MKKILINLDKLILALLCMVFLYGIYEFLSAIINNSQVFLVFKSYLLILIVAFFYIFYRKNFWGTEIFISLIFFMEYIIFMPNGFNIFSILYSQVKVSFQFGFELFSSLTIIMAIVYILLMILPIVHFLYLKKNKIAPYN